MQPRTTDPRTVRTSDINPVPGVEVDDAPAAVEQAYEHPEKTGHPDGVPHDIVGRLALVCVAIAGLGVFAYFAFGVIAAVVIGAVALWLMTRGMGKKARRERTAEAVHEVVGPHPPDDGQRPEL